MQSQESDSRLLNQSPGSSSVGQHREPGILLFREEPVLLALARPRAKKGAVLESTVGGTATSVTTADVQMLAGKGLGLGGKPLGLRRRLWILGPFGPHSFLSPQGRICSHDTVWLKSHPEV